MVKKIMAGLLIFCTAPVLYACDYESKQNTNTHADKIIVHCGLLIDGLSNQTKSDQTITILDGRIIDIAENIQANHTIDLSDLTCLPGLIDTHTHITEGPNLADLSVYYDLTLEETMEVSRVNTAITLAAGFTTVRNLGAYYGWAGKELRHRIERGDFPGPRIQTAGYYLTIPSGGGDLVIPGYPEERIPAHVRLGVGRGAEHFAAKAKIAVEGGADVLKAIASGAVLAFGGVPGSPEMTQEELSIKQAVLAGADSIEHASLADDEAINLAAKNRVAFSMDIYNGDYISAVGTEKGWPEEFLRKNDETTEAQRQTFTKAHAAGVPIIYGTDAGVYPHGDNAKQFRIMVERGMTSMEAIKSATSVAADFIGWEDAVGAIEPGRYGDIIAVRGNPLEDITILENVEVVIKGGKRFK
jgi:imidazolonepropionase-like amidohydrolase